MIDASNAVFRVFAEQDAQRRKDDARCCPARCQKTKTNLGKFATAFERGRPDVAQAASVRHLAGDPPRKRTRTLFKDRRRSSRTRCVRSARNPAGRQQARAVLAEAGRSDPGPAPSFSVFNEFFNELAYNPGPKQGGFLFFLDWANHNFNSVLSSADAHGTVGHTLVYFNCELVNILKSVESVNPAVRLILGLLNPPTAAQCAASTAPASSGAGVRAAASLHHNRAHKRAANAFDGGLGSLGTLAGKRGGR